MSSIKQLLLGLIAAIGTALLVLGALSMALVEDATRTVALQNTLTVIPLISPTGPLNETPAITLTASPTLPPVQPTACPTPDGWLPYVIQPGDTLEALAERTGLTAAQLRSANCLSGVTLIPNAILHLPASGPTLTASVTLLPTLPPTQPATITPIPCGPPPGWVPYVVQRGDTLFRLSIAYGVTQDTLRIANCMTGTNLIAGQVLYVPFVITRTPVPTNTSAPTSAPPTATEEASPTAEPIPTSTFTATVTVTPLPSATPVTPEATQVIPTNTPVTPEVNPNP